MTIILLMLTHTVKQIISTSVLIINIFKTPEIIQIIKKIIIIYLNSNLSLKVNILHDSNFKKPLVMSYTSTVKGISYTENIKHAKVLLRFLI